jgi:hypothetical protein
MESKTDMLCQEQLQVWYRELAASQAREKDLLVCLDRARRALLANELDRVEIAADIETCIAERGADHKALDAFVALAYQEGIEDAPCPFYEARVEGDNGHAKGMETCELKGDAEACMGYSSFCNLPKSREEEPQRTQRGEKML